MGIDWYRDLVICISGLVFTAVVILLGVLAFLVYRKTRCVLDSIEATSDTIYEISSTVRDEVVRPAVQVAALIRGISQGIDLVSGFFKKRKK